MPETRTPASERIESTCYGERQHETATGGSPTRYGEPQHDPEPTDPDAIERLGYEDDHWVDCTERGDGEESDGEKRTVNVRGGRPTACSS